LPITFDHRGAVTNAAGVAYKYDAYARIVEDATGGHRYTYDGANRTNVWGMSAGAGPTDTWVYDGVDHPLELSSTSTRRGTDNITSSTSRGT
jgi:hypothetical protein